MRARLEFQPRSLAVGVLWSRGTEDGRLHVVLCFIPALLIHITFGRDRRLLRGKRRRPGYWRRVRY